MTENYPFSCDLTWGFVKKTSWFDSDGSGVVEGQAIIASRTVSWTQLQLAVHSIIFRLVLEIVY